MFGSTNSINKDTKYTIDQSGNAITLTGTDGTVQTMVVPYAMSSGNADTLDNMHSGAFATASHTHLKADITNFPASMPASDVYSWAKASAKPTYTYTEVGAAASSHTHTKSQITDFPSNNVTGSGTSGYLAKWNGANTITNGPAIGSSTTTFLRNDGSWATPVNSTLLWTNSAPTAAYAGQSISINYSAYNLLGIEVYYTNTSSWSTYAVPSSLYIIDATITTEQNILCVANRLANTTLYSFVRGFTPTSAKTSLAVGNCLFLESSSNRYAYNYFLVPYKIWGIK